MRLPFLYFPSSGGKSLVTAQRNIQRLLKRLRNNLHFAKLYNEFISEYQSLNHLNVVKYPDVNSSSHYYIAHHVIMKSDGNLSKIRVVFNGSSKPSSGSSRRDILHTVSKVAIQYFWRTPLLQTVLHRFPQWHLYNVQTNPGTPWWSTLSTEPLEWWQEQSNYLWAQHSDIWDLISTFLAGRVLNQLILDECPHFQFAIDPMTKGCYVDDISGGADTPDQLLSIV